MKNPDTRLSNHDKDEASMSDTLYREMRAYVLAAAEPRPPGDTVKAAIVRASRELLLPVRRVTTFWYGNPAQILAEELEQVRRRHDAQIERQIAQTRRKLCDLQAKHAELRERLAR